MGSDRFWRGFTWAAFGCAMLLLSAFARWGVENWSWWFTVPVVAAFFAIGYYLDKRAGRY